jgi:hypothetical protein
VYDDGSVNCVLALYFHAMRVAFLMERVVVAVATVVQHLYFHAMRVAFLMGRVVVAVATVVQHLSRFSSFRRGVITPSWTISGQKCSAVVCMFGRAVYFGQHLVSDTYAVGNK